MEYFVDAEPGLGRAKAISYTYTQTPDTIETGFEINPAGLAPGAHQLYVRYKDTTGLWSPWLMHLFVLEDSAAAAVVDRIEYFIDKEPRPGKASALAVTPASSVTKRFDHSVASLSDGAHYLHVRSRMDKGLWSPWQMHYFFVEDTVNAGPIHRLEYFIDKEPRPGKANAVSISPGDSFSRRFSHSVGGLSGGQHYLHVRNKISSGLWSPWQMQLFYVDDTSNAGPIQRLEYFIDKEPRPGKGNAVTISPSDSFSKRFSHSVGGLSGGQHYLHVRNKISTGLWSPWQMQLFYVDDTVNTGPINKLEYFIDKEPRPEKGNAVAITPADSFGKRFNHALGNLKSGAHYLHVRNKISSGLWSPWQMQLFYISDTFPKNSITGYSYSIDSSLQDVDDTTQVRFSSARDTIDLIHREKTKTSLSFGRHMFRIWAQQNTRLSSVWHADTFTVIDCPMLDTAAYTISGGLCKGDTLKFRQNITPLGIWPRDSFNFRWFLNGSSTPASGSDTFVLSGGSADSVKLRFAFTRKSDARCKGEISKTLYLRPAYNFRDTFSFCSGDSVIKHGRTFKTTGTFNTNLNSRFGCDSIWQTRILVRPTYLFRDTFTLCQGDSVLKHGKTFKTAGTFSSKFNSSRSCDSSYLTLIRVNPRYSFKDTVTLCSGDSLLRHGRSFKVAGTFSTIFSSRRSCDSSYSTTVFVHPVYRFSDSFVLCQGDSVRVHGKTFKNSGSFNTLFSTVKGCDSSYQTRIQVNPVYLFRDSFTICQGDSLRIHGKTFKNPGSFSTRFASRLGCDSTYISQITVHPSYQLKDSFVLCSGDSAIAHGKTFKSAGMFTTRFSSINGCDSIYTTRIRVNPVYHSVRSFGLCGGDSLLFESVYRKTTGTYTARYFSRNGCDSVLTLHLTVDSVINTEEDVYICNGDSLLNNGVYVKSAGDYLQRFTALKGCDSLATRHLYLRKWDSTYLNAAFCFGGSYRFFQQTITQTGRYQHMLTNRFGCDSLVIIDLSERPQVVNTLSAAVCFGDSAFVGKGYKRGSGVFRDTLSGQFGCDSIVVYTQTERPQDIRLLNFSICSGDSIFSGNTFKKAAGIYRDTLLNRSGCDSIVVSDLKLRPRANTSLSDTFCFGDAYTFFGNTLLAPGQYTHTLSTYQGCDSLITLSLFRRAQFIPGVISLSFTTLSADSNYAAYQWYLDRTLLPGDTLKTITVKREGVYDLSVRNRFGCVANSWDDPLGVQAPGLENLKVYPNPNGGTFYIQSEADAQAVVYNALGVQVLSSNIFAGKQEIELGDAPDGVYLVYIRTAHTFYRFKLLVLR